LRLNPKSNNLRLVIENHTHLKISKKLAK